MPFDRRSWITLALLGVALPLALGALGARGLVAYVALWVAALPLLLPALRPTLVAELSGALFLFLSGAFADNLDDALGTEQKVSLALVALSFVYLFRRRADARALVRSPLVVLLALFYAQQIASAWWFGSESVAHLVQNRISLLAALLVGAVLARRSEAGRRLTLWLVLLAALVSVPLMLYEVGHPDFRPFSFSDVSGPMRAGGLFGQANVVGIALDFAIAALFALRARGEVSRGAALGLGGAAGLGVLACASRGAVVVGLVLLLTRAWEVGRRRAGRAPLATMLLAVGVVVFALPALARGILAEDRVLAAVGFEGVDRLNEVVLALSGKTDELADDDSSHVKLAAAALQRSSEHPLVGFGTGRFTASGKGSEEPVGAHVEFLQILGENGAVGLGFYLAFLAALALALARLGPRDFTAGLLLVAVWLLAHFESHDMHSYRFTMIPLAWVCGLDRGVARRDPGEAR